MLITISKIALMSRSSTYTKAKNRQVFSAKAFTQNSKISIATYAFPPSSSDESKFSNLFSNQHLQMMF